MAGACDDTQPRYSRVPLQDVGSTLPDSSPSPAAVPRFCACSFDSLLRLSAVAIALHLLSIFCRVGSSAAKNGDLILYFFVSERPRWSAVIESLLISLAITALYVKRPRTVLSIIRGTIQSVVSLCLLALCTFAVLSGFGVAICRNGTAQGPGWTVFVQFTGMSTHTAFDVLKLHPPVNGTAAVAAIVHDAESHFVKFTQTLLQLAAVFKSSCIVIVESNSKDSTRELLQRWAWEAKTFASVEVKIVLSDEKLERIDFAYWRNMYLDVVLAQNPLPDYMVVFDSGMDGLDFEGVRDSLVRVGHQVPKWGAILANGRRSVDKAYYDVYAFRGEFNGVSWWWDEVRGDSHDFGPHDFGPVFDNLARKLTVQIPEHLPLIQVQSAFGGLGIYRTSFLGKCRYCMRDCSTHERERKAHKRICEHVPFSSCIQRNGGLVLINPRMTVQWHKKCADCCKDLGLPCERCTCAPLLVNASWVH